MISSMTGFVRKQREQKEGVLIWEISAVNNRYLDIHFRLPETFRELDPVLREQAKEKFHRGKIDCNLYFQPGVDDERVVVINHTMLKNLNNAFQQVQADFADVISVDLLRLLNFPGMMQIVEVNRSALHEGVSSLFAETLVDLAEVKAREGGGLRKFIEQRLENIKKEIIKVQVKLPEILQTKRENILKKLNELPIEYDEKRLEQELVLLAQKIDVSEELERLQIHVEEIYRMLKTGGVVGRRLDFMMQELNREANTLGSKSAHEVTSHAGVELKVLIEQMREQIQNIE